MQSLEGLEGRDGCQISELKPIITPPKKTVCLLSNDSTKILILYEDSKENSA